MDRLILSLKKRFLVPAVCCLSVLVWLVFCDAYYKSYWEGTIERVQTVDFNLLHHTLPATLSHLILTGDDQALQRVLDSTYGIFGLVVTDPSGRKIMYKTDAVYKHKTWQDFVSVDYLSQQKEPFDVLLDPPPSVAQYMHKSPRQPEIVRTGHAPSGRVIGRVYYLRGIAPSFISDLSGAVTSSWFELSGSKRGYILLTANVIGFSLCIILLILLRKTFLESKARELEMLEGQLVIRRRALDQLNADLTAQRQRKEWLETEADLAYRRALRLKESLEKLKEAFFLVDMSPGAAPESSSPGPLTVRPPLHPPSAIIAEVESLLPDLTNNARILRSQAEVLQSYCTQLESRQAEMQRILEHGQSNNCAVSPQLAQLQSQLQAEKAAP